MSAALLPRLAALALRRSLPLPLVGACALLACLAARQAPSLSAGAGAGAESVLRGLARLDVWSVFFGLALPALLWLAARLGAGVATNDADWLLAVPAPRGALCLALGAGTTCAGFVLALGAAFVAEAPLAPAGTALRWRASAPHPDALLFEGDPALRWQAPALLAAALPEGARLRLWVNVAPGVGPAVTARLALRAGMEPSASPLASVERRIHGRTALELSLPAGARDTDVLELERIGQGAVLVLPPRSLELFVPARSERSQSVELLLRAALLLLGAQSLALGLGCWMRPALAALVLGALALLPWSWGCGAGFLPAGDLPQAWSLVAQGISPDGVGPAQVAGALVLAGLGLGTLRLALVRGRRAA